MLLATDADWIVDEVTAALGGPDTTFTVCRDGRVVSKVVAERCPDLAVLDLQVGSMGGMATAMALRLDESGGLLPHVKILMLLDRVADVYLAQRSGADGWIIKPLDALRLKRAALAIANGERVPDVVAEAFPRLPAVMARAEAHGGQVERAVIDLAEAVMLQGREGEIFPAIVTDVDERGVRMQLGDLPVVARVGAHRVEPGDAVEVRLIGADPDRRVVSFQRVA